MQFVPFGATSMDAPDHPPKWLTFVAAIALFLLIFVGVCFGAVGLARLLCAAATRLHLREASFGCKYFSPMLLLMVNVLFFCGAGTCLRTLRAAVMRAYSQKSRWIGRDDRR